MTRIFDEDGRHVPVTVLKVDECQVVAVRNEEKDGYVAVQLGAGKAKVKRTSKPIVVTLPKQRLSQRKSWLNSAFPTKMCLEVGAELGANHFVAGQYVDVTSDINR